MKKIFLLTLIILAVTLTACSSATAATSEVPLTSVETKTSEVVAEGKLLPATYVELAFIQPGIVAEVLVAPGDRVTSGTVIARLRGSEAVQAELAATRLEKIMAEQNLDTLQRQALLSAAETEAAFYNAQELYNNEADRWNPTDREDAKDLVRRLDDYIEAEDAYRTARQELDDLLDQDEDDRQRQDAQKEHDEEKDNLSEAFADLLQTVAENEENLDQKQIDMLLLVSNLEIAREQLDRLNENINPDLLSVAEARLDAAKAHIAAAETALKNYELRAPFAGTILSLNNLTVGKTVNAGFPIAFLADLSSWQVQTTDLAEIDIASVTIGAPVTIKLDAFLGEEFSARVVKIDPVGREHLGDMTYQVTLELDESDSRFLWNMTATVEINGK